ncbi:PfkB family carbohydrate kinase [candidate division KSB1 bacterium]
MITSIGLNPCIDTIIKVPSITAGHYDIKSRRFAGGTAINVLHTLKRLQKYGFAEKDINIIYSGFIDKNKLGNLITKNKYSTEYCVFIDGESRTNYTLIPPDGNEMHLKSEGPTITRGEYTRYEETYSEIVEHSDVIIISGKLPKNAPDNYYNTLVQKANKRGILTAVDIRGELLRSMFRTKPFFIKCNLSELSVLLNKKCIQTYNDLIEAEKIFKKMGVSLAVVSGGSEGIYIFYNGCFLAQCKLSEPIKTKNTTGAGDVILTCFAILLDKVKRGAAKLNRKTIQECSVTAAAYASASTLTSNPAVFSIKDVEKLLGKVIIIKNFEENSLKL